MTATPELLRALVAQADVYLLLAAGYTDVPGVLHTHRERKGLKAELDRRKAESA